MKKLFTMLVLFVSISCLVFAKKVDESTARTVGINYFIHLSGSSHVINPGDLILVYSPDGNGIGTSLKTDAFPVFYVFNFTGAKGYIIVAGDDIVTPVLGYSLEGSFSPANIAPAAAYWLKGYEEQIKNAVIQKLDATPEIEASWKECLTNTSGSNHPAKSSKAVQPLIKLYWSQSPYYNNKCPKNDSAKELTVTGCVATAMAMVMKYHNYPKVGTGSYKYKTEKYGTLEANFGNTRYQWDIMPDSLYKGTDNITDNAVATLMYHCGIGAGMEYGLAAKGGSGAWVIDGGLNRQCAEKALKTYFGYDPALRGLSRLNYTDKEWTDFLEADLDAGLPVIYVGNDPRPEPLGGGHAFICDGYDANELFHFNWGWGGYANNYFRINALNPGGSQYNCGHEMLKGVRPMPGQGKYYNLNLSAQVTLISGVISYKDSISVTTMIRNNGTATFNGSLGAAIFDTNQVRIGFVEIDNPATIQPGERYSITFRNSELPEMLPGKYMIGILYSSVGDDWMEVNDTLSYVNFPVMEVINPDLIEMASPMTIVNGPILTEGKAATVKLVIRNIGSQDFSGTLNLAIHDIDGIYMYSLAQMSNVTLPAGSSSGQLTFSTDRIPVAAGSYMLALWHAPSGGAEYELVGSTGFQNPVKVQVNASPLVADRYEPNNTVQTASLLPVPFSGNTASVKLENANCHVGTDVDYYKIELPKGFSYIIHARLENSEYDTSSSHPLNGIWNYLAPPDTLFNWPCDNSGPTQFVVNDGGTVYFLVKPNYIAQTGMYQLNISISKNPLGIEESEPSSTLVVYPNPSSGIVYLTNRGSLGTVAEITVSNMIGRSVYHQAGNPAGIDPYSIDLSGLTPGIYIVAIRDNMNQQRNIKVSIAR